MMNFPFRILLGSKSPRRLQILKEANFIVDICTIDIDETFPPTLELEKIAEYLAKKKASAYSKKLKKNEILICADTVVICNGLFLGKPKNKKESFEMLLALSGNSHKVITGVCLKSNEKTISFSEETIVSFSKLTESEINYYIENFKPFDKAGSYGIQEWIGLIGIDKIYGSYFNVVGLPIHAVYSNLKLFL